MITKFKVDNVDYSIDIDQNTPLLWVLRETLNLTNTKFGCGVGECGACTVLMDNKSIRACTTPISMIINKEITTIANENDKDLKKLQNAWIDEDVSQCGYCQPGQIINALGLIKQTPLPSDEQIIFSMNGNICRCGTYNKIKTAIKIASKS
ncbi:MAG: (2Fe-2S)-binding protein [Campylobacteraceae bacterium]|nr:(2Fe-2S)-binding protein [Campylobacteraceae bacterium]